MNKLDVFTLTRWNLVLAFAGLFALCPNEVGANTVALAISTSNRGEDASGDLTLGWQFTVNKPILVTDLGVWDGLRRFGGAGGIETPAGGGLGEAHTVTIWDANGNALAQATVPAGTVGTLVDVFRYVSLPSPLSLQPGTYSIGAYYAGFSSTPDGAAYFADPITTAAEISYTASVHLWEQCSYARRFHSRLRLFRSKLSVSKCGRHYPTHDHQRDRDAEFVMAAKSQVNPGHDFCICVRRQRANTFVPDHCG